MKVKVVEVEGKRIRFAIDELVIVGNWIGTNPPSSGELIDVEIELGDKYSWGVDIGISIQANEHAVAVKIVGDWDGDVLPISFLGGVILLEVDGETPPSFGIGSEINLALKSVELYPVNL